MSTGPRLPRSHTTCENICEHLRRRKRFCYSPLLELLLQRSNSETPNHQMCEASSATLLQELQILRSLIISSHNDWNGWECAMLSTTEG